MMRVSGNRRVLNFHRKNERRRMVGDAETKFPEASLGTKAKGKARGSH
jgi:hypothetical protein